MKKETFFYTPMTSPEKKALRRTALCMFGLMAAGCLALIALVPLWYGIFPPDFDVMLIVGAVIMVSAIPFHILAGCRKMQKYPWRRVFYLPAILLNLVGMSLFEAAYYTSIEVNPPKGDLIAGAVIPVALCLLCALGICLFTNALAALPLIFGGVGLVGVVTCIVFWVKAGLTASSVLWSFALFNLVGVLIMLIAYVAAANDISLALGDAKTPNESDQTDAQLPVEDSSDKPAPDAEWGWLRFLSFASFGLFMIVAAVVLIILMCLGGACDCDCDCCDCGGGGGSEKKSTVKRRTRR